MKSSRVHYTGILFLLPSLTGVLIFVLLPFADVIRRSFTGMPDHQWAGLDNYINVFRNEAFQLAAGNTLRFLAVCMPLLILSSLAISVYLSGQTKIGQFLKNAYLVPMAIPVASVVILWKVLFHKQGLLSGLLSMIGLVPVDWMNSKYAFWVLVFSYVWKNIGYNIVLWMAGLSSIPTSIYEAARVDGAGEWKLFTRITLPNLFKVFYTIIILSLLNSFKVFREAYLVAGNYPDQSMYLVQHLFQNWYRELSLDKLSAAAVVIAVGITMLVLPMQNAFYDERPERMAKRRTAKRKKTAGKSRTELKKVRL